jgi:hypothetical protein
MDTGDVARLGEVHGAETPGSDQTHPDRTAIAFTLLKKGMKIHNGLPCHGYRLGKEKPRGSDFLVARQNQW